MTCELFLQAAPSVYKCAHLSYVWTGSRWGHLWPFLECQHFVEMSQNIHTPCNRLFFLNKWLSVTKFWKKKKKKQTVSAVLRFLPFHARAHKSSACNAWTAAALRLIWRMLPPRITLAAIVLFIPQYQCLTSDGNVRFNYLSFFFFVGCRLHVWFEFQLCFSHCLYALTLILEWFPSTHA